MNGGESVDDVLSHFLSHHTEFVFSDPEDDRGVPTRVVRSAGGLVRLPFLPPKQASPHHLPSKWLLLASVLKKML